LLLDQVKGFNLVFLTILIQTSSSSIQHFYCAAFGQDIPIGEGTPVVMPTNADILQKWTTVQELLHTFATGRHGKGTSLADMISFTNYHRHQLFRKSIKRFVQPSSTGHVWFFFFWVQC
jgi:hypothetical protein